VEVSISDLGFGYISLLVLVLALVLLTIWVYFAPSSERMAFWAIS
jgi:hypothetical protein